MSALVERLRRRAAATGFAQAVRLIELAARRRGTRADVGVGGDMAVAAEPVHFAASDRMALVATEIAGVEEGAGGQPRIAANVLGLAGATPALPPFYSEIQLQRRRLRDRSLAAFLNLFDHRALSFFYRIVRKYSWPLEHEREGAGGADRPTAALLAYAGLATPGMRDRLGLDDAVLAPLAHHLGDMRRSAASIETVLRRILRLPLRVVEAEMVWMAVPPDEQSRLGQLRGAFCRLGASPDPDDAPDGAMIGAAVLDAQHHYAVEVGPLGYDALVGFCADGAGIARIGEVCRLAAGIEHRPVLRLTIRAGEVPPLRLGLADAPVFLGRNSWMALDRPPEDVLADCTIPIPIWG